MFISKKQKEIKKAKKQKQSVQGLISLLLKASSIDKEYKRLLSLGYIDKNKLDIALEKSKQYKSENTKTTKTISTKTVSSPPQRDNSSLANLFNPPQL